MYILLSGSMPFYAENPADFLDLILTAAVVRLHFAQFVIQAKTELACTGIPG